MFNCVKCICLVKPSMSSVDSMYRMVTERFGKIRVVNGYTTNWYQSQGFDTEPRWASGVVFEPKIGREIGPGMANFGCWFVPVCQVVA